MANNQQQNGFHFWLRDETKEGEKRCALTPKTAAAIISHGNRVTVESSTTRCFSDAEFSKVGCKITETNWEKAPLDAIIVGLKELPDSSAPLVHRHIYFAHCYKKQKGWNELLKRFESGKGVLFDMEYLVDDNLRRVAAFGKTAGFVGCAIGIKEWCMKQTDKNKSLTSLQYYENSSALILDVKSDLEQISEKTKQKPVVFIMGALGRCGSGATALAKAVGLDSDQLILWDLNETKNGGPFREILDCDVFVNCIYLNSTQRIPPFLTKDLISQKKQLSVVVDVSCDTSNPNNPLPIYSQNTTFSKPFLQLEDGLTLCSIDHLPSLVPSESSMEYSEQLLPHLIEFGKTSVWKRAETVFSEKMKEAQQQN